MKKKTFFKNKFQIVLKFCLNFIMVLMGSEGEMTVLKLIGRGGERTGGQMFRFEGGGSEAS